MHISVKSIRTRPGASVTAEFFRPMGRLDDDIEVLGPVHLTVTATNLGGRIGLQGRVQARLGVACSRCAEECILTLDEPVQEFYVRRGAAAADRPAGEADVDGDLSLDADPWAEREEADERVYDGDDIQLGPLVRELLLLALPMKPVCRDDCRGICPSCGVDLNEGVCDCEHEDIDPRLAALKQWVKTDADTSLN